MDTKEDLQITLNRMQVGDTLDIPLRDIKDGKFHPRSNDPMASFRNFISTQSRQRVRSRLQPSYYCCRIRGSDMRVYCVNDRTESQVPSARSVGQPKKYHFDTAKPGTEFWFPAGVRDHQRMRGNIHSAAYNQGVRVSIRSVRAPEPGLRVWVRGPRDKPATSLPKLPNRLPDGHPFRQARVGHRVLVPVEWHEDRYFASQRAKALMKELSKDVHLVPSHISVEMWAHPFVLHNWDATEPLSPDETPGVMVNFVAKPHVPRLEDYDLPDLLE